MTYNVSRGRPERGFLGPLRRAALVAALVGAVGSVGFLVHAAQRTSLLLLVLLALWVLSPFVVVVFADVVSKRWSVLTRATLYGAMLVVTLGSLAIYLDDALRPRKAQPGFVFVVAPLTSWLLIAMVIPIAALISGRLSRRSERG